MDLSVPYKDYAISIHALREEGDVMVMLRIFLPSYFYPRPPRGGRRTCSRLRRSRTKFLSTPSARRATCGRCAAGTKALQFLSTPSARRAT